MISRRDALKFGAAGLAGCSLGTIATPLVLGQSTPEAQGSNPGPGIDRPIVVRWRLDIDQAMASPAVIADGKVLAGVGPTYPSSTGDSGSFLAISAESGEVVWSFPGQASWWSPITIDDSTIFVSSALVGYDFHHSEYHALDLHTGEERWRYNLEGAVRTVTVVTDSIVLFVSSPADSYGPGEYATYALNKESGELLWSLPYSVSINDSFTGSGQIFLSNGLIIHAGDPGLTAIDVATGQNVWQAPDTYIPVAAQGDLLIAISDTFVSGFVNSTGEERWRLQSQYSWIGWYGQTILLRSNHGPEVICLDPATGQTIWVNRLDGIPAGSIIANHAIYQYLAPMDESGGFLSICAVDPVSGQIIWQERAEEGGSELRWNDGFLFSLGGDTTLSMRDAASGQLIWSVFVDEFPNHAQMTPTADVAFVYSAYGDMYALNNADGQTLFTLDLPGGSTDGPTVGDGIWVFGSYDNGPITALGNLPLMRISQDTTMRGAPHPVGVAQQQVGAGATGEYTGITESHEGLSWYEVTIDGVTGWIPQDAIDPATLPPEGEVEYVYIPG